MFNDPKFLKAPGGGGLDMEELLAELPPLHEHPLQNIQGGIDGEHYHLTELEHDTVATYIFLEPVSAANEIVFDGTGDIVWTPRV